MKKQNIIFTIVIGLLSMCSYAQSSLPFDEQYFLMDKFLINPSFTGDSDDIVFKATHRRQWDNMPNGPVTTLASAHDNIVDRLGIGMYLMNDHNGNTKKNRLYNSESYNIQIVNK